MQSHQKTNHSLKHACDICGATYARGIFYPNVHQLLLFYYFWFYQGFALKDHIKEQHGGVIDELGQVSCTI